MERKKSFQSSDIFDSIPEQMQQQVFAGLAAIGSMCLNYQEQKQEQEEQQRQNEDIKAIWQTLERLQQEQQLDRDCFRKERTEWTEKQTSYEKRLQELQNEIESKGLQLQSAQSNLEQIRQEYFANQKELERLEQEHKQAKEQLKQEYESDLEQTKQKHQSDLEQTKQNYQSDLEYTKHEYESGLEQLKQKYEEEMQQLKQDNESEHRRLEQEYQSQKEQEYGEIQTEWEVYHKYREWMGDNAYRIPLSYLNSSSFETFIVCCGKKKMLGYIYKQISQVNIWDWRPEDIEILDNVIDCCIAVQRSMGQELGRTEVQPDSFYDPMLHNKREEAPSNGRVIHVLLRGVMENGGIVEECKSFVELD